MSCTFWLRRKREAAMLEKERQAEIRRQAYYEAQKQAESVTKEEEPETKGGAKNGRRADKKS